MALRPIKLLLLACIACWATGAAQYVHERLEHCGPAEARSLPLSARAGQSANQLKSHTGDSGSPDHDDCPTCQMLAHMAADRIPPAPVLCVPLPAIEIVPLLSLRAGGADACAAAYIRGPPSVHRA